TCNREDIFLPLLLSPVRRPPTCMGRISAKCWLVQRTFVQKLITVRASVKPTMHGTYLGQPGCADSILVVLPEGIPHYVYSVQLVKDAGLDAFLQERFNYRPDASRFDSTFSGQLEYSGGQSFATTRTTTFDPEILQAAAAAK